MTSRILEAALKLSASSPEPSKLDADHLVAAGACTEEEFAAEFTDLASFHRALATELFAQSRDAVIRATEGMAAGLPLLERAFLEYLDYNLAHRGLQELAHHLQYHPEGLELLLRMEVGVALVAQVALGAMGSRNTAARAKLLTSLVVVVVRAEYRAQKPLADMREGLLHYCRMSGP